MSFILYINWITQFLPGVQLGKIYLTSNFFDIGFIKGWNMLWLKITSGAIFGKFLVKVILNEIFKPAYNPSFIRSCPFHKNKFSFCISLL